MGKEMKWMGIILMTLCIGYLINSFQQGQYNSKSDRIFSIDKADVFSIEITRYSLAYIFGLIFGWIYCKKEKRG